MVYFTFIHTPNYSARAKKLLSEDDQRNLEELICEDPFAGVLQAGVRKIRVSVAGRGKRGGLRIIYHFMQKKGKVYLLDVLAKNERSSLTKAEQNEIRKLAMLLEGEA